MILATALGLFAFVPHATAATCHLDAVRVMAVDDRAIGRSGARACGGGALFSGTSSDDQNWTNLGKGAASGGSDAGVVVSAILGATRGGWSADFGLETVDAIVIRLKAGRRYVQFLLDDFEPGSKFEGTFSTLAAGLVGKQGRGLRLSQMQVLGISRVAPVPVPGAGFLLIGALGGLVMAKRRRRTASS